MKHDSIILFGRGGVGKDTLVTTLNRSSGLFFVSIKFSAMTKSLINTSLGLPGVCDDRERRTVPSSKLGGLSPLELLDILFKASSLDDRLTKANQTFAMELARHAVRDQGIPVFTDIRRKEEVDAVEAELSPLKVYLHAPKRQDKGRESDNLIDESALGSIFVPCDNLDPVTVAQYVLSLLEL